jgi:small subunit ribosomal protein S14
MCRPGADTQVRPYRIARDMATTAKIAKEKKTPKFKIRLRNRCHLCGRPRAYMRKFALCRLCFRKLALEGDVTGVTKSSW